jgi:osmotically inducible protein OsmC
MSPAVDSLETDQAESRWNVRLAWRTHPPGGRGELHAASGAFTALPMALADTPSRSGQSTPGELLAAAHATGFAATLAFQLEDKELRPREITVTATCVTTGAMRERRLTRVELELHARLESPHQAGTEKTVADAVDHYRAALGLREDIGVIVRTAELTLL